MKTTFWTIFVSGIAGLALTVFAVAQTTTDVATIDETKAEKAFPAKPPYSPYAEGNIDWQYDGAMADLKFDFQVLVEE